jgi:hypothetical protein
MAALRDPVKTNKSRADEALLLCQEKPVFTDVLYRYKLL